LGVVGSPIDHSKSPLLHAAAYTALGLDWSYGKHDVPAGTLNDFVAARDSSWRGLSVTMPLKREAFALSATVDAHAQYTEAVNTLAFSYEGGARTIRGFNTDVFGIVRALQAGGVQGIDHAVLIGAGATAESALVALDELGAGFVTVALRDLAKAERILGLGARLGIDVRVTALRDVGAITACQVTVSTVPGSAELSLDALKRTDGAVLLDAAYDVWPSPRAQRWTQSGGVSVSGLSMLAQQALKQVRIFVSGAPDAPLPNEPEVLGAMFASVGLNEKGL